MLNKSDIFFHKKTTSYIINYISFHYKTTKGNYNNI